MKPFDTYSSNERLLTYGEAIREAVEQEMDHDDSVFVMGQGVDDPIGIFGTTKGFPKQFGGDRCFDTPLAEEGITGVAIGAAQAGMRPILTHIRMDFMVLAMNQLVNIAAKTRYMYSGAISVPLVVRAVIGRSWGQGAQHSQALHSWLAHIPGLKVVMPSTPYDVKGTLIQSIRENDPIVFVEHRMLYKMKSHVPEQPYALPLGKARTIIKGDDISIVATGHMASEALRAVDTLENHGIYSELIDPVTISPLDIETIANSVRKTGRLLVVDNGWTNCGFSAEVIASVTEALQEDGVSFKSARMGFAPTTCPTCKPLENLFYPNDRTIVEKILKLCDHDLDLVSEDWMEARELVEFKGPF